MGSSNSNTTVSWARQLGEVMKQRFEMRKPFLKNHFSRRELRSATDQIRTLGDLPAQPLVPCPCDYQPGNWVVGHDAIVRVIDFAGAEWHAPAFDMTAVALSRWWGRPHLREAFLEGYGCRLTSDETEFLRLCLLIRAMAGVRRGRTYAKAGIEARGRDRDNDLLSGNKVFTASFEL